MEKSLENIFRNLVRIGTVISIDAGRKKARVNNMVSGWLFIIQRSGADVSVTPDGRHTHTISDTFTGKGSASTETNHNHQNTTVTSWMPKVNDTVLVLYLPVFNADGFLSVAHPLLVAHGLSVMQL